MIRRVEIEGRCGLTADEICDLLDCNLDVPIGESKSGQVTHRLFYSQLDDECFVAFQSKDKAIISVWPAKWHHRRKQNAWAISEQAKEQARQVITLNQPLNPDGYLDSNGRKIFVNALIETFEGAKENQIRLGELRVSSPVDLKQWILDSEVQVMIKAWIRSVVPPGYQVCRLLVKQGKKNGWVDFDPPR